MKKICEFVVPVIVSVQWNLRFGYILSRWWILWVCFWWWSFWCPLSMSQIKASLAMAEEPIKSILQLIFRVITSHPPPSTGHGVIHVPWVYAGLLPCSSTCDSADWLQPWAREVSWRLITYLGWCNLSSIGDYYKTILLSSSVVCFSSLWITLVIR